MKLHLAGLVALAAFVPVLADFDFNQPQSPPLPKPAWVKMIDQGANDPRLKGYFTPEGIKVEIVADFPTVVNPVGMTFGDDGTPYVLEWLPGGTNWNEHPEVFTYKDGSKRTVATMKKPKVKDVVKVLRDTKGKGVYDEAKVIIEEELPSSILVHDGWIYVSGRGTVRRYKQSKAGGPYDVKEVIAQGFCGFHHHQVSGLSIGNDGWLYITSGDDDNYVEGSDGSRATVLRTGAVFRCRPDGSKMHAFSIGYRNPYRDVVFDDTFNIFHADNDNEDGSKFTGCRLMHVAEESDFGWRLHQGARCCQPDPERGAVFGELPGKLPPLLKTGRGAPAGLLIYNDSRFPEQYQGLLYYPDVFRKLIRAYRVTRYGSTFRATNEFEFMKSDDPLFRPCQMVLGPDGAMYVVDWRTNSGGAGQLSGDGQHGRIYRLSWSGTADDAALPLRGMDSWAKIAKMTEEDLLQTLSSENFSDRLRAQRELVRRGPRSRPALLKILKDPDEPARARIACLGALQSLWDDDVRTAFVGLLRDGEGDVRRLVAEGLGLNCKPGDREAQAALLKNLGDDDLAVRRAMYLAMGRIGGQGTADALVSVYQFLDENDVYLRDGLLRAIERLGKPGIERLVAMAESGVDKDRDKVIEAFVTLRTRPAAEAIPGLLTYPHNTVEQRVNLIRSYNNYLLDPPVYLKPLVAYLTTRPKEPVQVKMAGLEVLAAAGQLKGGKLVEQLLDLLDVKDGAVRLAAIKAVERSRAPGAVVVLARRLRAEETDIDEQRAILRALRVLNDRAALPAVQKLFAKAAERPGEVQLRLETFRTLAALDAPAGNEAAQTLLDEKERALQTAAIAHLGSQPAGAKLVGERFLAKKLSRELLPQVSDALRRHAAKNPDLNKLLNEVIKGGLLVSLDKAELERVEKLVRSKGNASRGKALYLNANTLACIKCHRLEGVGGSVGPDLTRLWDTHSIDKLIESIVDPSKEIKEGFHTYVATTKKGQVFTGLKISQNADEVVLRDANAQDIRIAVKDLDELVMSKQSLMPDNVVSQLSFDQFLDLVAFLKDRPAQESLRGMALEFWVVGPFAGDPKMAHPPETKPDPAARYPGPKEGTELTWQARAAEPNGLLKLGTVKGEPEAVYALTYVYSPKDQKARLLVGAGGNVKVWVNGGVVHEGETKGPPRPDEAKVEVTVKPGWNPVLVKQFGTDRSLYLRFADAADLRVSIRPEGK